MTRRLRTLKHLGSEPLLPSLPPLTRAPPPSPNIITVPELLDFHCNNLLQKMQFLRDQSQEILTSKDKLKDLYYIKRLLQNAEDNVVILRGIYFHELRKGVAIDSVLTKLNSIAESIYFIYNQHRESFMLVEPPRNWLQAENNMQMPFQQEAANEAAAIAYGRQTQRRTTAHRHLMLTPPGLPPKKSLWSTIKRAVRRIRGRPSPNRSPK
jgi:hypothetical protein